jgi:hypothetical protein
VKLSEKQAKLLRAALRKAAKPALKRAFALIRAHDDHALLAAMAPSRAVRRRRRDPLVRELERTLKPIMAPAREKAELLIEQLARMHRRKLSLEAKGLADAARQLRVRFSDAQIGAAARSLLAHLARRHGQRDTVV